MADVNYLGFANMNNGRNPTAEGLSQMGQTLDQNRAFQRQAVQDQRQFANDQRQNRLADMQINQQQAGLDDAQAQRQGMQDVYGAATPRESYAMKYREAQQKEAAAKQKELGKFALDTFSKVSEAVKAGTIDEANADAYFHSALKLNGMDLEAQGIKLSFKKQGGYYSGPVTEHSIFMVDGKPVKYGNQGIVEKARIVGLDPQTQEPIYQMDKDTTFKENRADSEALLDKRLAAQAAMQDKSLAASDRRTSQMIEASDRRAARSSDVAQSTFVDPATGKPLVYDKKTGSYRVANIEGGVAPKPSAMSPEAATRAQQFDTVLENIPKIKELVFDKNGKVDRGDLVNATVGTPFTKGREIKQTIKRTIEQTLRIATGAAAPDSEVASYMKMYSPQVGDTDAQIAKKIDALEAFSAGAKAKYNVGRSSQAIEQQSPPPKNNNKAGAPKTASDYLKKWNK